MHEETTRSRFVILVEPEIVLFLAFAVSILLSLAGFLATAVLVENDPIGGMLGTQRKLDIELTPRDGEVSPKLEDSRSAVAMVFEAADVIVIPGESAWRLVAWIDEDPTDDALAGITVRLAELGWDDVVPKMTTQPRYLGAIENPRINQRIVDVLEGSQPAFVKRRLKYQI